MMVLGSREQLCIHDKVSLIRGRAQNNACHFVCRKKAEHRCQHFSRVSGKLTYYLLMLISNNFAKCEEIHFMW